MANWSLHLMRSTDSKSLWNYTLSPGWREEEISVLRLALMKFGVGRWNRIREFLPGKTVAQLNLQTQRLFGQQSLGGGVARSCCLAAASAAAAAAAAARQELTQAPPPRARPQSLPSCTWTRA
jgi:hypothetical protein